MSGATLACVTWRKSSHSGGNGNCVEVASPADELVAVRDSKTPGKAVVIVGRVEWVAYLGAVKRGDLR
ncbi:hypothetical protein GCM10009677_52920 [Sphaerisporangium rubeum]|uniref:DUF397 domain-containing protein n=1 Tax=Sphaerisporangium rubeum TaxID=321317 RepID=A0A7X0IKE3_9ACTN|nr:DUF397 domain-containing protein [Sphaerisporangium rubeum]MBB6475603.1 hypothetical protein [Sphaerisporangium rubeum]